MARTKKLMTDEEIAIAAANSTPDVELPSDDETEAKAKGKEPRWTPLPEDRTAWIAAHARPAISACLCGCGGTTKGRFVPGHDATLKESLKVTAEAGNQDAQAALATFGW